MNKKSIETLSVNAVRNSIVISDFLDQFISDNDKEPSWDGHIYIYKDKSKRKDRLKGRLPIQVKGTENDDFSKEEISFPVSIVDLNNYLYDGGIIFFVVYIGHNGLTNQIYYAELPPIKLRVLLSEAKGQKSKRIRLKKFPTDANKKAMIFFNCLENCQKQSSFSDVKLLSLEELEKQDVLEGITVPVSSIDGLDPKIALLTNEVYIYAKIKGSSIPQPLEMIPQKLTTIEEKDALITVGEKLFYKKVTIYQDADSVKTVFGESFSITAQQNGGPVKINYKNSDKLRVLAIDLDFMLSCIAEGGFSYDGVSFPFDKKGIDFSNFSVENQTVHLLYIKKMVQLLDLFGCRKDLSIKSLKDKDWKNINTLLTAFIDKKPVTNLKDDLPPILSVDVENLKFVVYLQKVKDEKGTYRLFDFFKTDLALVYENSTGEKLPISQYAILHADDFIRVDNIRFDVLLPSFQKVKRHSETMTRANFFLLDLLEAYDKHSNPEILKTAKAFSEWIMATTTEEEIPYDVRLLNTLQIEKRQRALNIEEVKELFRIIENPKTCEDILVGSYLLLDQQAAAHLHFEKLDKQLQEEFKKYPIYHFWNDG